jgi:hypothetical protein
MPVGVGNGSFFRAGGSVAEYSADARVRLHDFVDDRFGT